MKVLLAIALLVMGFVCCGQDLDSLKQRILTLETNQKNIQLNLAKAHDEFKTGTLFVIAGALTSLIGAATYDGSTDGDGNTKPPTLIYIGLGCTAVGAYLQIDSHKYIGRAGRRRK